MERGEWKGKWSNDDVAWEQYPIIQEKVDGIEHSAFIKAAEYQNSKFGGSNKKRKKKKKKRGKDGKIMDSKMLADLKKRQQRVRGEGCIEFWMEWGDMVDFFTDLVTCIPMQQAMYKTQYNGKWRRGDSTSGYGGVPPSSLFSTNPSYPLSLTQTTSLFISLSQVDLLWEEAIHSVPTPCIGFIIQKLVCWFV